MDAETRRNFIIFLEKNPKLYTIAKSDRCVSLLERLSLQGLPVEELKRENKFSYLSESDLGELLDLLVQLKVLNKQKLVGKTIYFANENTKIFLEIYNDTKKQYSVD